MGRTRTAASELDLEPLEVRVGLQGRVRALLSLALPHVEKMPSVVPLASLKEGAPERRPPLMNETKTRGGRLFLVSRGSGKPVSRREFTSVLALKKRVFLSRVTVTRSSPKEPRQISAIRYPLSFGLHADRERPLPRLYGRVHPERHVVIPERRQRRVHQERPPVNLQLALAQDLRGVGRRR